MTALYSSRKAKQKVTGGFLKGAEFTARRALNLTGLSVIVFL
jgi:hypothetical protein